MDEIFYKVLTPDRKSIRACSTSMEVEYELLEWTHPRIEGTPLMVFSDYSEASNYLKDREFGGIIVRCKIEPYTAREMFRLVNLNYYCPCSKRDWDSNIRYAESSDSYSWPIPRGTVFASRVFCLE